MCGCFTFSPSSISQLKRMAKLCLRLPQLITEPVPLLKGGTAASLTLSQLQVLPLIPSRIRIFALTKKK